MPHIDGITLATIIGTEFPQTATLILTTFTDRQLVDKALAVGVLPAAAHDEDVGPGNVFADGLDDAADRFFLVPRGNDDEQVVWR